MRLRLAPAVIFLFVSGLFLGGQNPRIEVDRVVVYKQQRKLVLLQNGKEVRSYKIALGSQPVGPKVQQGDHRTPEGTYVLDRRNSNSQFYKAFHLSYPNSKDVAAARRLRVSPGGDIMLHGLPRDYAWVGKAQSMHDWTDGCIAVSNEEMDELWSLIHVGTPIDIRP
jgi:murein L,D-transpeptidase YafK